MNRTTIAMLFGLAVCLLLVPGPSYGQNSAPATWQQLPDWSGVWSMQGGTIFDKATQTGEGGSITPGVREHPPYNAEYEAMYENHLELRDANRFPDVQTNCGVPVGFPRIMNLPDVYEFVLNPKGFWLIAENGMNVMRVYTDGRALPGPEDRWGTYSGVSVGHWEGDTLVWKTAGLKGWTDKDSILDRTGLILSDAAEITTRMRKTSDDMIEAQMTIEDSKALTKPWVVTKRFRKNATPFLFVYDYGCAENNRNPVDTETGETLFLDPEGNAVRQ